MDWDQERSLVVDSQAPVAIGVHQFVIETESCLAWVSNVRVYDPGVEFDFTMLFTAQAQEVNGGTVRSYTWDEDEPGDVRLMFAVDGEPCRAAATNSSNGLSPAMRSIGGASRPGHSSSQWWLAQVPSETLRIEAAWDRLGLVGSTTMDTRDWRRKSAGARRLSW